MADSAAKPPQQHGLVILDKPEGPTSAGCLARIKRHLGQKKIGHAGTLDPMATGVLLVLLGQGTKLATYLTGADKTYTGRLKLGVSTDTYDAQGKVVEESPIDRVDPAEVESLIASWNGITSQEVPPVSAAKHQGKPLYALARTGQEVPVKIKSVEISHAEVLENDFPWFRFRVRVSSGTYIRSLVHSLGIRLGCGAMLDQLTREHCHPFGLDQAVPLDRLLDEPGLLEEKVLPLTEALPLWPRLILSADQERLVRNGARLPATGPQAPHWPEQGDPTDQRAFFTSESGAPLAMVEARQADGKTAWAILRGLWN